LVLQDIEHNELHHPLLLMQF